MPEASVVNENGREGSGWHRRMAEASADLEDVKAADCYVVHTSKDF